VAVTSQRRRSRRSSSCEPNILLRIYYTSLLKFAASPPSLTPSADAALHWHSYSTSTPLHSPSC
jgi:hypothetical protein